MRVVLLASLIAMTAGAMGGPIAAQPAPAPTPEFTPAPWWMDKPVIPALGRVWTETPANRATASATYQVVDRDVAAATKGAADKVRQLSQALTAFGADKVVVATTFAITPLYEQYRDKQGEMNDNERADKIERYQVSITVRADIRDARLAEQVYATLMSAKPTSSEQVSFRLEAENETLTQMSKLAAADARRRATLAAEAAGARLGAIRLIDPTGRACQTDVLVSGSAGGYGGQPAYAVAPPLAAPAPQYDQVAVTARRRAEDVGLRPEDFTLPLQVPMRRLDETACVVFALG